MEQGLQDEVRRRLEADGTIDAGTRALVVAACTGVPLADAATAVWPDAGQDEETTGSAGAVFLQAVTVQGFRGIGPSRTLELQPGPGLTLVVGRNGSGKSSFAEGLEMCLTGQSTRWAGRHKAWQETWRNLHDGQTAAVAAELVGVDAEPRTLTHTWPDGGDVLGGTSTLDDGRTIEDLGWTGPLAQYRPLLSFTELGAMFDEPKRMYDAIAEILGVHDVRAAAEALRQARLEDRKPLKTVKDRRPALISRLRASDDPRADEVLAAIDGRTWDLRAAAAAIEEDSTDPTGDLSRLRALAALDAPHPDDATAAAAAVRQALAARDAAAATDAGRADRVATLLRHAVDHVHADGPQPCPLCGSGTVLDETWAAAAAEAASDLAAQARAVRDADTALAGALRDARRLLVAVPEALHTATFVGLDADAAIAAWDSLVAAPDDPAGLADHLQQAVTPVHEIVRDLAARAALELDRRQDDWRPLALEVARWVQDARDAQVADARAVHAEKAEKWLAETAQAIEAERFAPISEAVQRYWQRLRLSSNVALAGVAMKRSGASRSLALDVTVDDSGASALGVMSQGELHALALAVFLPRATIDASPFRFLVLDDPVQAMDPARVDGLAHVLAEVAETRQVVVFTHDTRLPDAVRRLQIPATVVEVSRQPGSAVTLRTVDDPVRRYLDDARAISKTQSIPEAARAQLVPQMCRSAIEAAAMDVYRGRRLRRGEPHEEVEAALADRKVHDLLALALFDGDGEADGAQVFPTLSAWGRPIADAFADCKEGTHVGERRLSNLDLVDRTRDLIRQMRTKAKP